MIKIYILNFPALFGHGCKADLMQFKVCQFPKKLYKVNWRLSFWNFEISRLLLWADDLICKNTIFNFPVLIQSFHLLSIDYNSGLTLATSYQNTDFESTKNIIKENLSYDQGLDLRIAWIFWFPLLCLSRLVILNVYLPLSQLLSNTTLSFLEPLS